MAGWDDILSEIALAQAELSTADNPIDTIRRKYINQLSNYTKRNTIAYYSSFLTKPDCQNTDINDSDMSGFMNVLRGMDCRKGLDLFLHTPGGSPVAAEAIVKYLRSKFGKDIRVIVPQIAMSAGTMIACSANTIFMGKHSSLGPIDPQFNGIPAYNIKMEFEDAKNDLVNNASHANYWAILLQKYPAAFLKTAIDAIDLSGQLLVEWLGTSMFDKEEPLHATIIANIVQNLNEHDASKAHGRHFDIDFCRNIGLKITDLEADSIMQDCVLSVHHAYIHSLSSSSAVKIIENDAGKALINQLA